MHYLPTFTNFNLEYRFPETLNSLVRQIYWSCTTAKTKVKPRRKKNAYSTQHYNIFNVQIFDDKFIRKHSITIVNRFSTFFCSFYHTWFSTFLIENS